MHRKKIAAITMLAIVSNLSASTVEILAQEMVNKNTSIQLQENEVVDQATITKFELQNSDKINVYNESFKMNNSNIAYITNNGGRYANSTIDRAIDGNLSTHWETGKPNNTEFTNEVVVTLNDVTNLNRIVYAARQDGARGKGFAQELEIYASLSENEDDFKLVTNGSYSGNTGDLVEIKFKPTEFKRIKFRFKKANQDWASASEFMFYKEDTVKDKMERLFTDASHSKVSEEFNTIEKINSLEEIAKSHPLYEEYKNQLEDAKILINEEIIQASEAKVSKFDIYYSKDKDSYDTAFKMNNTNIQSIVSAGSKLNGYVGTENIIDGNLDTYWETGRHTNDTFKNELTFTFKEATVLDRIAYRSAWNTVGFSEEFEIWASNTTSGDTFQRVSTGNASKTADVIEIKFNPTNFKRLKFVFKNGGTATASEMMFYKEDKLHDKLNNMFTNGLMNELTDQVNSLEKIQAVENELENYPLNNHYLEKVELAKKVLQNPSKYQEGIVTASQRGDANKEAREHQIARTSYSLDTFGKYVTPGETIKVYVDAHKDGVMPTLVFGQLANDRNGWTRFYNLKPGLNTITAPGFDNMAPAVIYIQNPALPTEQAYAPKVRIEGGTSFPVYYHGITDPIEYEKELEEYNKKVSIDDNDFASGIRDDVYYNVTELVSQNNVITTSAKGALEGIKEMKLQNKTVKDTMNDWEKMWHEFQKFGGFVENDPDPRNDLFNAKFTSRVFTKGPIGWSDWGYTGYNGGNTPERNSGLFKTIVMPFGVGGDWIYYHEWGHNINNSMLEHVEVTNNLYSAQMRRVFGTGGKDDRIDWNTMYKRFSGEDVPLGFWTELGMISQPLYYYGTDLYGKASRIARTNQNGALDGLQNNKQRLVITYSLAAGYDLTDYFEGWNYCKATDLMKTKVSHLPKPNVKLEYMNTSGLDYKGEGFTQETNVNINSFSSDKELNKNTLTFSVDKKDENDVMGYEILRDGNIVGYTTGNSFVDKNIDTTKAYTYEVVAYAKDLTTSKKVSTSSEKANLLSNEKITIGLNEEFEPLNYVNAFDKFGNEVNGIKVTHNVDTSKKGIYNVDYEVEVNGIKSSTQAAVEVVSKCDYLSDSEWTFAKTDYDTIRKNRDLKLFVNGEVKNFDKGFGIHANGEIVYDLSNKDYDKFEAFVGVSRSISQQDRSSIDFKILADGIEVYNSGLMKYNTPAKYVSLDVKDVKELKIVIGDTGNGISSDHAVIANPILTTNNSKPNLTIPKSISTKVGEKIDLNEEFKAVDIEDGDLTSKVEVSGKVNFYKPGKYEITYKVVDSDLNEVIKTRSVAVVDMRDSKYLSDFNWKSESHSYAAPVKDKSVSWNALRLTDENGQEVSFEKGIGSHSTSTIVYNLSDKDYAYFTSYVGVDRQMYNSIGSVSFEVYVDGAKKFDSGLMNSKDPMKYLEVDINGAKELKLVVTNGGNGQGSDHATWGDSKLHFANPERESIESEVRIELRELVEYADTLTKDMIGATNHIDARWNNFLVGKQSAKEHLEDFNKTDEEVKNVKFMLNYYISELYIK